MTSTTDIEELEGPFEQIAGAAVGAGSSGSSDGAEDVDILLDKTVITGKTVNVDIGEGINLTVRPKGKSVALTKPQWKIPGKKVLTYTATTQLGSITPFPEKALSDAALKFYWHQGGQMQISVTADLTKNGNTTTVTQQCVINVKRPSLTASGYQMPTTHTTDTIQTPSSTIYNGTYTTTTILKRQGDKGDGKTCWVQLIPFQNIQLYRDADLVGFSDATGLDTKFPYAAGTPEQFVDNPSVKPTNPGLTAIAAQVKFKTYLMYKSKTTDSIWVPMQVTDWHYNWSGNFGDAEWTLNHAEPQAMEDAGRLHPISGADTDELPVWANVVTK